VIFRPDIKKTKRIGADVVDNAVFDCQLHPIRTLNTNNVSVIGNPEKDFPSFGIKKRNRLLFE
jgi:hypothetical protein